MEVVTPARLNSDLGKIETKLLSKMETVTASRVESMQNQIFGLQQNLLQSVKVVQAKVAEEHGRISRLENLVEIARLERTQFNFKDSGPLPALVERIEQFETQMCDETREKYLSNISGVPLKY
jgi:hypothetical protein